MSREAINKNKIKLKIESLEKESRMVQATLNQELEWTKGNIVNIAKIVLGVGGGLIFSAILLKGLLGRGGSNEQHRVYHRFRHQLLSKFSIHATNLLLGIAKDKLGEFIKNEENAENQDSGLTD